MSQRAALPLLLFFLVLVVLAVPGVLADPGDSLRTVEVLRYGCANELGHREVTLFGNGTVRLLDGPPGKESMGLVELAPEELAGFLNRLNAENLSETHLLSTGIAGPYIERCELRLDLPGRKLQVFHFAHYDTLTLPLSRVLRIADDLEDKVQDLKLGHEELPEGYEPRQGDVVKRKDGYHYRIIRFTSDNKGVELQGTDQPFVLYVLKEQMRQEFVALVSRRP
jgi:hypothetical protein